MCHFPFATLICVVLCWIKPSMFISLFCCCIQYVIVYSAWSERMLGCMRATASRLYCIVICEINNMVREVCNSTHKISGQFSFQTCNGWWLMMAAVIPHPNQKRCWKKHGYSICDITSWETQTKLPYLIYWPILAYYSCIHIAVYVGWLETVSPLHSLSIREHWQV